MFEASLVSRKVPVQLELHKEKSCPINNNKQKIKKSMYSRSYSIKAFKSGFKPGLLAPNSILLIMTCLMIFTRSERYLMDRWGRWWDELGL